MGPRIVPGPARTLSGRCAQAGRFKCERAKASTGAVRSRVGLELVPLEAVASLRVALEESARDGGDTYAC